MKYSKGDGVYWTGIVAGKSTGRIPYYILKVIPNDDSETLYLLDDGYPGKVVPEHELVSTPGEFLPEMDILRKETK